MNEAAEQLERAIAAAQGPDYGARVAYVVIVLSLGYLALHLAGCAGLVGFP